MHNNGFPPGSIMARMAQLGPDERAMIGGHLALAIHARGTATVDDFDQALKFVQRDAEKFFVRLHGGPFDGDVQRLPLEFSGYVGIPKPDREVTSAEVEEARVLGKSLNFPVTTHGYSRRPGSPVPEAGGSADFDYVGTEDRQL